RAHPKWGERPVLLVEMRPDSTTSEQELLEALRDKVASWWVPDEVIRLEQMPLAATGKVDKMRLRAEFGAHSGDGRRDVSGQRASGAAREAAGCQRRPQLPGPGRARAKAGAARRGLASATPRPRNARR